MTDLAIVTGASGGIGLAIAASFLESGATVVGVDVGDSATDHDRYRHERLDITDSDALARAVAVAVADDTSGDVTLVNAAGIREIVATEDLSVAEFRKVLDVNTTAVFVASQSFCSALPEGPQERATIVNIASVAALLAEPHRTAYVASKHAVIGLTKQFALEYAHRDIRVNAVAPGVIRTPLTEDYFADPDQVARIHRGQLLHRIGTPADVSRVVRFLADPASAFITGTTVVVDGGWTVGKEL